MKVTTYSYKFTIPDLISENEYASLKDLLLHNPSYNPFKSKTPGNITFLGIVYFIGIPCIILYGNFEREILRLNDYLETLINIILGIFMFLNFGAITQWGTMFSYLGYIAKRSTYYSKLKNSIINSCDYQELKTLMK